jgi:hypothetical protein
MADNTFLAPLSPIQRSTPAQNLIAFQKNEYNLYNKFSPYYQAGGDIGSNQPYIYTKLTDSNFQKNLTRYDTTAFPVGSTARDVIRMTKFSTSGIGLLYTGKQLLLQQQNAFNETRIYNPLSLLKATARPGSLGLIGYPQRHLETSGGLLNFFKDSLLSTFGFSTKDSEKPRLDGTATGENGVPYSEYASKRGGAKYGLLRYPTASKAVSNFNEIWASNAGQNDNGGGFLQKLASGLVDKLRKLIPSTNPLGAFGGSVGETWKYRPEYETGKEGIYYSFLNDRSGLLKTTAYNQPQTFYNDRYATTGTQTGGTSPIGNLGASDYHKYYPAKQDPRDTSTQYAPSVKIQMDSVGITDFEIDRAIGRPAYNNLKDLYSKMVVAMLPYNQTTGGGQFRSSAERYTENPIIGVNSNNNYESIPNGTGAQPTVVDKSSVAEGPYLKYLREQGGIVNEIRIDNRGFAKASKKLNETGTPDDYNLLTPTGDIDELFLAQGSNQSRDLIFFYFYDLINQIYIPFRATLGSIQDNNTADWDDIKYMGRADKLFVYKGFSRDLSFNFRVYANSIYELVPNWERVNYLVGLTRPSKYTDRAIVTNEEILLSEDPDTATTGRESGFIYPPMIEFRIGDLYVDQPAILRSVGVTVPDDAHWETLRDNKYTYVYGKEKTITQDNVYSRQLPTMIDVSVQLSVIEREQSQTKNYHFGPQVGWSTL